MRCEVCGGILSPTGNYMFNGEEMVMLECSNCKHSFGMSTIQYNGVNVALEYVEMKHQHKQERVDLYDKLSIDISMNKGDLSHMEIIGILELLKLRYFRGVELEKNREETLVGDIQ